MEQTYQKTSDGRLEVITTETRSQKFSRADLEAEQADIERELAVSQARLDEIAALLAKADELGVEVEDEEV